MQVNPQLYEWLEIVSAPPLQGSAFLSSTGAKTLASPFWEARRTVASQLPAMHTGAFQLLRPLYANRSNALTERRHRREHTPQATSILKDYAAVPNAPARTAHKRIAVRRTLLPRKSKGLYSASPLHAERRRTTASLFDA